MNVQDGDGYVSQDDYKLAKRFDFDGNGVIDPYERNIAKHVIADEFFKAHKDHIHVFGSEIASASHEENVFKLENSTNFERSLSLLKEVENSLRGRSSKEMIACMASTDPNALKYNYYSNKFDTMAWNSTEGIPSFSSTSSSSAAPTAPASVSSLSSSSRRKDHEHQPQQQEQQQEQRCVSRNQLLQSRKYSQRNECKMKLEEVYEKQPKYSTQRLALITNPDLW